MKVYFNYINKTGIAITFLLFLLFLNLPTVYATTLYSNNFKTIYTGFDTFFGTCTTSNEGLTCSGAVGKNTTALPTVRCLSSSIKVTSAYANLLFLTGTDLSNHLGLEIKSEQNMRVLKTVNGILNGYDTGQKPVV